MTGEGVGNPPLHRWRVEVAEIELSDGTVLPASKAKCPSCGTLDVHTEFVSDSYGRVWLVTCPVGHEWWVEF